MAACTGGGQAQVNYSAEATVATPTMVEVEPGVQVVTDYDQPVFFNEGVYWRYDAGVWYRSPYHNRGWVRVEAPPVAVRHIQRPEMYVHYHANANANANARAEERHDANQERKDNREVRQDQGEVKHDNGEIAHDRADVRADEKRGDEKDMKRDEKDMKRDEKAQAKDEKDLKKDEKKRDKDRR